MTKISADRSFLTISERCKVLHNLLICSDSGGRSNTDLKTILPLTSGLIKRLYLLTREKVHEMAAAHSRADVSL